MGRGAAIRASFGDCPHIKLPEIKFQRRNHPHQQRTTAVIHQGHGGGWGWGVDRILRNLYYLPLEVKFRKEEKAVFS